MKFIKFENANASIELTNGEAMHYYTHLTKGIILCAEIDKEDLKIIRDNGRIYILLGDMVSPPAIGVIAKNPFMKISKDEN